MKKIIIFLMMLLSISTAAQDENSDDIDNEPHPLLEMMAFVPDTQVNRDNVIAYADIRASENSRGFGMIALSVAMGVMTFDDYLDVVPIGAVGIGSLQTLPDFAQYLFAAMDDFEATMGFRIIDIDRTLYFGERPGLGHVFDGNFNQSGMNTAMTARNYDITEETDNLTVWCHEGDCTDGIQQDLAGRNMANIFGGQLGREEPIALMNGFLLNSAENDVLRSIIGAAEGDFGLLMDDPAYAAALNQITTQEGMLRQLMLIPAEQIVTLDAAAILGSRATDEVIAAFNDEYLTDFVPIPAYELATMADFATDTQEISQIYLVYENEANAEAMAVYLATNLLNMQSLATRRSWGELLTDRSATVQPIDVIQDEATGKFITVISFHNPLPPLEDENGRVIQSGLSFHLLISALYRRDLIWLATELAEDN